MIEVGKKGYPHGFFKFTDVIKPSSSIDEPQHNTSTRVQVEIIRTLGTNGRVTVSRNITIIVEKKIKKKRELDL